MSRAFHAGMKTYDIDERTFRFACAVIAFVRTITWEPGVNRIIEQLVDSSGGTGANRHESSAGSTPKEFVRLNTIALREARESHFWLRVCQTARIGDPTLASELVVEADEIVRILATIVMKRKASMPRKVERSSAATHAAALSRE